MLHDIHIISQTRRRKPWQQTAKKMLASTNISHIFLCWLGPALCQCSIHTMTAGNPSETSPGSSSSAQVSTSSWVRVEFSMASEAASGPVFEEVPV